jgi:hypothetical protein
MLAIRSIQNDKAVFVMLAEYPGYHSALSDAIGSAPVARRADGRQANVAAAASHLLASAHRKESRLLPCDTRVSAEWSFRVRPDH